MTISVVVVNYNLHYVQLLGNKQCDNFPTMTTSEFADKFMASIKAPDECRSVGHYCKLFFFTRGSLVGSVSMLRTIHLKNFVNGWTKVLLWAVLVGSIIQEDLNHDYKNNVSTERETGSGDGSPDLYHGNPMNFSYENMHSFPESLAN